jgi:hypothetical protein
LNDQELGTKFKGGKVSKACREDEGDFVFEAEVGGGRGIDRVEVSIGHEVKTLRDFPRTGYLIFLLWFLCGTCNICFKLDRSKKAGEDKKVKNVSTKRNLRSLQDV